MLSFRGAPITLARVRASASNRTMRALGRVGPIRDLVSRGYTPRPASSPLFPGLDPAVVVSALRDDGIYLPLALPEAVTRGVREFAETHPCYGDHDPSLGFLVRNRAAVERAHRPFTVAAYFNTEDASPLIRSIAKDPLLAEVARRYVGPRARQMGTLLWWSFAGERSESEKNAWAQLFHYDLDDYKFLKFFFYITAVDDEAGPHVYVRGTHRSKSLRHTYPMRRLPDVEIERAYGSRVTSLTGPAGHGFAEDTFGFHKGLTPTKNDRLLLQVAFSISHGFTSDRVDPSKLGRARVD